MATKRELDYLKVPKNSGDREKIDEFIVDHWKDKGTPSPEMSTHEGKEFINKYFKAAKNPGIETYPLDLVYKYVTDEEQTIEEIKDKMHNDGLTISRTLLSKKLERLKEDGDIEKIARRGSSNVGKNYYWMRA